MARNVNVGLVGYSFMGKAHSHAFKDMSFFFPDAAGVPIMKAICGRNEENVRGAAAEFGWEGYETDWKTLIARDDIDLIDVSTPGDSHAEIAIAARKRASMYSARNRWPTVSLKPAPWPPPSQGWRQEHGRVQLPAGARRGAGKEAHRGRAHRPGLSLARRLPPGLDHGPRLSPGLASAEGKAGSGPHGDLNAHIIDLARYLIGEITEVTGMQETFIKERPIVDEIDSALGASAGVSTRKGPVTVDDTTLALARFENGAVGSFEATRFAGGRRNGNRFEINGSKGSISFSLERMNELQILQPGRRRPCPGVPRHHRDRRRPSLHGPLVAAGAYHRLGTHLYPRGLRSHAGHRRR